MELDRGQVLKAAAALLKHCELSKSQKSRKDLLETPEFINVQVALIRIPEQHSPKPKRISIPHPLFKVKEDDDVSMCLIVKDDCKAEIKELLMKTQPVLGLRKVLSLSKLKKNFGRFAERRGLLHDFDIFLADDRILPSLSKALGKKFYEAKKMPFPLKVTRSLHLAARIAQVRDSTFYIMGAGPCQSVRVAHTNMKPEEIADNVEAVIAGMLPFITRQWRNIQSINIKTGQSVALPVYNAFSLVPSKIQLELPKPPPSDKEVVKSGPKKTQKKRKRPLLNLAANLQAATSNKSAIDPTEASTLEEEKEEIVSISAPTPSSKKHKTKKPKSKSA